MSHSFDWEAEGLLEGCDGTARAGRIELLERLAEDGVPLEELKEAAKEERLALLPAERILAREAHMTTREAAEKAGVEIEFVQRCTRAIGLPVAEPDEPNYSDQEVEAFQLIKNLAASGLPEEGIFDVTRVVGHSTWRVAQAQVALSADALLEPGDTEADVAFRYAAAAEHLAPMTGPLIQTALAAHMRAALREGLMSEAELATGRLVWSRDTAVCFADLVGFTRLGEEVEVEDLGSVAGKLEKMAIEIAEPPVQLIKTIGDAVMLKSFEPKPLVDFALDLVEAADNAGERFPQLRAGLDWGPALPRGGDVYGRVVNVASRVTGIARPGSVLTTNSLRDAVEDADGYSWSQAGMRALKGVTDQVGLNRVRRASEGDGEEQAA